MLGNSLLQKSIRPVPLLTPAMRRLPAFEAAQGENMALANGSMASGSIERESRPNGYECLALRVTASEINTLIQVHSYRERECKMAYGLRMLSS
jgi:hypothetical protein